MDECLFCKIINKQQAAQIIYEDNAVVAVLDVSPRSMGHTMVLPKRHMETILEMKPEEAGSVFEAVKKVTQLLKDKLNPDGFTTGINHGKVSGQAIDHLHIHIIPRFLGDNGGSVHTVVDNSPKESLEEIAKKIAS